MEQVVFGHICSYITEPQGRLAALMALHDPMALRNYTPFAFTNSYKKPDIHSIINKFRDTAKEEDLETLPILTMFADDNLGPEIIEILKKQDIHADLYPLDEVYLGNLYN